MECNWNLPFILHPKISKTAKKNFQLKNIFFSEKRNFIFYVLSIYNLLVLTRNFWLTFGSDFINSIQLGKHLSGSYFVFKSNDFDEWTVWTNMDTSPDLYICRLYHSILHYIYLDNDFLLFQYNSPHGEYMIHDCCFTTQASPPPFSPSNHINNQFSIKRKASQNKRRKNNSHAKIYVCQTHKPYLLHRDLLSKYATW